MMSCAREFCYNPRHVQRIGTHRNCLTQPP
jgi:hypothetical protein